MARQPDSEDNVPADPRLKKSRLGADDKQNCLNLVVHGVGYLQGLGWKAQAIGEFLERVEVQQEIALLKEQYENRASIQERVQFHSMLQLNKMVPAALGILARALRGTVVDEASGKIVHRVPERVQYEAALEVMDRANIHGAKYAGRDDMPALNPAAAMEHAERAGGSGGWTPQNRDQVRKLLSKLTRKIQSLHSAEEAIDKRIQRDAKPVDGEVTKTETPPSDDEG